MILISLNIILALNLTHAQPYITKATNFFLGTKLERNHYILLTGHNQLTIVSMMPLFSTKTEQKMKDGC